VGTVILLVHQQLKAEVGRINIPPYMRVHQHMIMELLRVEVYLSAMVAVVVVLGQLLMPVVQDQLVVAVAAEVVLADILVLAVMDLPLRDIRAQDNQDQVVVGPLEVFPGLFVVVAVAVE
jgi:hypothetical protein